MWRCYGFWWWRDVGCRNWMCLLLLSSNNAFEKLCTVWYYVEAKKRVFVNCAGSTVHLVILQSSNSDCMWREAKWDTRIGRNYFFWIFEMQDWHLTVCKSSWISMLSCGIPGLCLSCLLWMKWSTTPARMCWCFIDHGRLWGRASAGAVLCPNLCRHEWDPVFPRHSSWDILLLLCLWKSSCWKTKQFLGSVCFPWWRWKWEHPHGRGTQIFSSNSAVCCSFLS